MYMTCQESVQLIQAFVDDNLYGEELEEFLWHIDNCPNCYDEMEVSYLLKEALSRLEDGTSFNLTSELKTKISLMHDCVEADNRISMMRRLLLTIAGLALAIDAMYLYLSFL